jgi:hypothetical protein
VRCPIWISAWISTVLMEILLGFPRFVQVNFGIMAQIKSVSSTSFPVHYALSSNHFTLYSLSFFFGWGETESTWYVGHCWPIVPAPENRWWLWSSWWNEDWQGKPKYSEKTCPSATLSTTNPSWPDLGSNSGRRSWKPATNRLSYGTAYSLSYWERH